jgi:hypothetical protein
MRLTAHAELILRSGMHRALSLYPSMPSVWCSGTREILEQICSILTQKPGPMENACDSLKEFTVYAIFSLKNVTCAVLLLYS